MMKNSWNVSFRNSHRDVAVAPTCNFVSWLTSSRQFMKYIISFRLHQGKSFIIMLINYAINLFQGKLPYCHNYKAVKIYCCKIYFCLPAGGKNCFLFFFLNLVESYWSQYIFSNTCEVIYWCRWLCAFLFSVWILWNHVGASMLNILKQFETLIDKWREKLHWKFSRFACNFKAI